MKSAFANDELDKNAVAEIFSATAADKKIPYPVL